MVPTFGFTRSHPRLAEVRASRRPQYHRRPYLEQGPAHDPGWVRTSIRRRTSPPSYNNEPSYSFSTEHAARAGQRHHHACSQLYPADDSAARRSSSTSNVTNAFGAVFGMLNNGSATYNYGINGQAIPFGTPITPQLHFELAGGVRSGHLEGQAQPYHHAAFAIRSTAFPTKPTAFRCSPTTSLDQLFRAARGRGRIRHPELRAAGRIHHL